IDGARLGFVSRSRSSAADKAVVSLPFSVLVQFLGATVALSSVLLVCQYHIPTRIHMLIPTRTHMFILSSLSVVESCSGFFPLIHSLLA
ncbi:hypothetical protein B0H14DRAFT_2874635, partial [Mycena olivaceomarginata]